MDNTTTATVILTSLVSLFAITALANKASENRHLRFTILDSDGNFHDEMRSLQFAMREAQYINGTLEASGRCILIAIDGQAINREDLGITGDIDTETFYPIPFEALNIRTRKRDLQP